MGRLLVVGELNPDIVVAGVPVRDGRLRFGQAEDLVHSTTMTLGSSAAITASAAARTGADVWLVAVVGDDDLGAACLRWVGERGVDTSAVRVAAETPTGSSVILVSADDPSDRQILTHLGAMAELEVEDLTDALLAGSAHVHVSSFFMHTRAREHLHVPLAQARATGATVSLDTNDDPDRTWAHGVPAALAHADILFCNDSEAIGLAGLPAGATQTDSVAALLDRMPRARRGDGRFPAVVHKLGEAGATVHTRDGCVHVAAPTAQVVDTVGAGDTLAGTVLAALLSGSDWPGALSRGVAAATLSTTATGGVSAQPTAKDTASLAATLTTDDRRATRTAEDNCDHDT